MESGTLALVAFAASAAVMLARQRRAFAVEVWDNPRNLVVSHGWSPTVWWASSATPKARGAVRAALLGGHPLTIRWQVWSRAGPLDHVVEIAIDAEGRASVIVSAAVGRPHRLLQERMAEAFVHFDPVSRVFGTWAARHGARWAKRWACDPNEMTYKDLMVEVEETLPGRPTPPGLMAAVERVETRALARRAIVRRELDVALGVVVRKWRDIRSRHGRGHEAADRFREWFERQAIPRLAPEIP